MRSNVSELFWRTHRCDVSGVSTRLTSERSGGSVVENKLLNSLACHCSLTATAISLRNVR